MADLTQALRLTTMTVVVDADGVALATLARTKQGNAFNGAMASDMLAAFAALDRDDRCKVIVVTGSGALFCAGADFREGDFADAANGSSLEAFHSHRDLGGRVVLAIANCRKTTIAAINGSAVGVGITMTLPMDIRYAHKDAKIGFVFARRGICMEACSSFYLPRLIGHSRALDLVLTGRVYKASDKMLDLLFSRVLDKPEDVLLEALRTAKEIAVNCSTTATAITRALVWRGGSTPEEAHLLDSKGIFWLGNGADSKEGVKAFLEKRPARFGDTVTTHMPPNYPWWLAPNVTPRNSKL
ncbi:enoyl-CoA hydratase/isomerase-like protein [Chytriomyces sp. MP71]|nr:enoyl-CoA hydratase/isomerase-like protein [Chytriomyces sp. MP71]